MLFKVNQGYLFFYSTVMHACADAEHAATGVHCNSDHESNSLPAPTTHSAQGHCHQELRVRLQ